MIYEYDKEVDGLYIWFVENLEEELRNYEKELWPEELKNEIGLLFDKNGRLLGMEIMPASKYFEQAKINKFPTRADL
ncbi:DUF2283 domain-containing protein [Chryseobacterium sp. SSA4.19]|uniref:DUF2283 domain-containing protein n=1 Tax=unclassified Chryseobacterium TaxID=2593645 RepID=UPI00135AB26F|nr:MULTISPECIES: DUF2283 domain-containing protein [unclassified Chryseobacterium]MCJ8155557.1 DUF2283 domain-containing protein [Chryseobacterium sp. SSA4.19]